MKNLLIVIHDTPAYGIDWSSFRMPNNYQLALLTTQGCAKSLSVKVREKINHLMIVEKITLEGLIPTIKQFMAENNYQASNIQIASVREQHLLISAELRDHLNFKGPSKEVILNFIDKTRMKPLVSPKVRVPLFLKFDRDEYIKNSSDYLNLIEKTLGNYPFFTKPIDGAGSLNTKKLNDRKELENWASTLEKNYEYEIDEFIEGTLYHCDSVIQHGKPVYTFVSKYLHPNAEAQSGKPLASMTMDSKDELYQQLAQFAEKALSGFPVVPDGLTHLEVFRKSDGTLIFLEVGARPPGGKVPEIYAKRKGVDIRALHLRLSFGLEIDKELEQLTLYEGPFAAMSYMVNPPLGGKITALNKPAMDSKYDLEWFYNIGDTVPPPKFNGDSCGSMVFWNPSFESLSKDFRALDTYNPITLSSCTVNQKKKKQLDTLFANFRKEIKEPKYENIVANEAAVKLIDDLEKLSSELINQQQKNPDKKTKITFEEDCKVLLDKAKSALQQDLGLFKSVENFFKRVINTVFAVLTYYFTDKYQHGIFKSDLWQKSEKLIDELQNQHQDKPDLGW